MKTSFKQEIENFKSKVKTLSYRDVLMDHDRNDPNKFQKIFHLSELTKLADALGYPYIIWNHLVYQKDDRGTWMRTPWTETNIH